jgi:hypothetical protein
MDSPTILKPEFDEDEYSASHPCRFTLGEKASGTHWTHCWVSPRADLDAQKKNPLSLPGIEPDFSVAQPVALLLYRLKINSGT